MLGRQDVNSEYISTHPFWGGLILLLLSGLGSLWWQNQNIKSAHPPTQPAHIPITEEEKPVPPLILHSFEAFCKRESFLDGKFLEKEDFINSMVGKEVEWTGNVEDVYNDPRLSRPGTILKIKTVTDQSNVCIAAFIFYGDQMKPRLYALRAEDRVRVKGIYAGANVLQGITFQLVDE